MTVSREFAVHFGGVIRGVLRVPGDGGEPEDERKRPNPGPLRNYFHVVGESFFYFGRPIYSAVNNNNKWRGSLYPIWTGGRGGRRMRILLLMAISE